MRIYKRLIFGFCLCIIAPYSMATSCWSAIEIAEMSDAEMEGNFLLSFKDAINCKAIVNAKVKFDRTILTTNTKGYVILPKEYALIDDGELTLQIIKDGYVKIKTKLRVTFGTLYKNLFAISPKLDPEKFRFVLQWGNKPLDLDLHLKSAGLHISYQHKKNIPNKARLDRDARNGFGPETITLHRADRNAQYELWVDNYWDSDTDKYHFSGNTTIDIYADNQLFQSITLARSQKRANHVLTLKQGEFTIHNKFSQSRP